MPETYDLRLGTSPLLLSQPHPGLGLAGDMEARLTDKALQLPDTDWHIPALYSDCAKNLNATVISALHSRYVVDLNRDPAGTSLYPGQSVTELCPSGLFDNSPLYKSGRSPTEAEIEKRVNTYWQPYHAELQAQIKRIRDQFGYVLLYDCHSIRSVVPRFFDGTLPDLNVGTGAGSSADAGLQSRIAEDLSDGLYSYIINGRFKGGYITRHYGNPEQNIHAIQMEIAQSAYMDENHPFTYDDAKAARLKPILQDLLGTMLDWGQQTYAGKTLS